jgi:hypothetical protein
MQHGTHQAGIDAAYWIIDFGKASILLDDRFPHTHGARKGSQRSGLYGINIDRTLHFAMIAAAVMACAVRSPGS